MTGKKKNAGGDEEAFEKTVVTSIKKLDVPRDEKAFILFIAGPLIGKMYLLDRRETMIGRADDVDISIADARISRDVQLLDRSDERLF
ncbi:MAG TPA: FHA domain-containing protein, partial [bacterium]|nr:FHA domain-containing protein [bacterium]